MRIYSTGTIHSKKLKQGKNQEPTPSEIRGSFVTDKVIKSLENKSLLENSNGNLSLQSIVGKFAEAKLALRADQVQHYQNAFAHNYLLVEGLYVLRVTHAKQSLASFNSQQGNFVKCISFYAKAKIDLFEYINFIDYLSRFFMNISTYGSFICALDCVVVLFSGDDKRAIESTLLSAHYYDGDFTSAYTRLQQVLGLDDALKLPYTTIAQQTIVDNALTIYGMEGEALTRTLFNDKYNLIDGRYPAYLFYLGEYKQNLAAVFNLSGFNPPQFTAKLTLLLG
jgi:hypothetical protein